MSDDNLSLTDEHVDHRYVQGKETRRSLERSIRQVLEQGKVPSNGWSELWIKHVLQEISLMESNNFPDNCGVGEREGRVACRLVAQRHFYLSHGIGRFDDVAEVQPKAAGSSLLSKLANSFALDVIKTQGVKSTSACLLVPVATGMALVLTMLTLKESRPKAKYVIWPRIDQKSCFKSILTSGLEPIIIENVLVNDHLQTDVLKIKTAINNFGSGNILCVMTTSSCFVPRLPDKLEDVALVCKENDIPHVVNNAYGIQSTKCMNLIQKAAGIGRVDAFIQSTDKNFMVPVGGSIIAGFDKQLIQSIGEMYPGRASASPIIDFFITMLSVGESGYNKLLKERDEVYDYLKNGLDEIGGRYGERCMDTEQNQISLALTLGKLDVSGEVGKRNVSEFGSYLFKRCVCGVRVVAPYDSNVIGKYTFEGWGAHHDLYPTSYLTAAASIGTTKEDIDQFLKRLDEVFKLFTKEPMPIYMDIKDADISATSTSQVNHSSVHQSGPDLRRTKSMPAKSRAANEPDLQPTKSMTETTRTANEPDVRPTKSMTETTRTANEPDLRPTKPMTETTRTANEPDLRPTKSVKERRRVPNKPDLRPTKSMTEKIRSGNKIFISKARPRSFSSHHSQKRANGDIPSSAASLARIRDDLAQQLIIPAEIPPDQLSFLIDI